MSRRIEALYDVTFRVPSTNLGTVLDAMKGAAYLVTVKEYSPPAILTEPMPTSISGTLQGQFTPLQKVREHRYAGGMRKKEGGIKGPELIDEIFADNKPHRIDEVGTIFVSKGFHRNSARTELSRGVREKRLRRIDFETYIKHDQ